MDLKIILPPLIGAIIGWLTNYVAIKLLFRPYEPVRIIGFKIQGLIPRRRDAITRSLADTIEKDLLSGRDIAELVNSINWESEVARGVEEAVDHRMSGNTLKKVPLIGAFSDNIKDHVKYLITREILLLIERKKEELQIKIRNSVDIKERVIEKIDKLDMDRFETMLLGIIAKELRHLEWLGALMGFLIGLVQAIILYIFF